jgi:NADH dehydrogenase
MVHMEKPPKKHIVIAGMGFAGINAYEALQRNLSESDNCEITAINATDSFVFLPMIHEVATGGLPPNAITQPLRQLTHRFVRDVIEGVVQAIDCDARTVRVARAEGFTDVISYDYLILAIGSTTHYFGVPGAQEHALSLGTLPDARRIRDRVLDMFDRADAAYDEGIQKDLVRFVIGGGGPTGVELAGELADLMCHELTDAFPHLTPHGEIVIIDRNDAVMKGDAWFSQKTAEILSKKRSIKIMTSTSVLEVTENGVKTDKGFIEAQTVIWCAGVHARELPITATQGLMRDEKNHRITVTPELSLPKYPEAYVVGDHALILNATTGHPYDMRAQFAVRQGRTAARNIIAAVRGGRREPFVWQEKGFIISLGKRGALAEVYGFKFSGFFAWVIFHGAYLEGIIGVRATLRTALEWFLNLCTPRDISRV